MAGNVQPIRVHMVVSQLTATFFGSRLLSGRRLNMQGVPTVDGQIPAPVGNWCVLPHFAHPRKNAYDIIQVTPNWWFGLVAWALVPC